MYISWANHSRCIGRIRLVIVTVIAPAFIHPSTHVDERYRALLRLVKDEFHVVEDLGRGLQQCAPIFTVQIRFRDVSVLEWSSRTRPALVPPDRRGQTARTAPRR